MNKPTRAPRSRSEVEQAARIRFAAARAAMHAQAARNPLPAEYIEAQQYQQRINGGE